MNKLKLSNDELKFCDVDIIEVDIDAIHILHESKRQTNVDATDKTNWTAFSTRFLAISSQYFLPTISLIISLLFLPKK